jgi:hypothetical protein
MKQTIEFLGRPVFVVLTWSILTVISFFLSEACKLTTNFFLLFPLTFLLYFGTMAYGFFYFHAFPTHRISPSYYRKKKIESLEFYKTLGVEFFRNRLINSPFKKLNQRVYLKGRKDYIAVFLEETKRSETSHLIGLLIGLFFHLVFILNNAVIAFSCSVFFNLVMNLYPILLQRFNRIKIRP